MEIKIVYDNRALPGFTPSHGFSCLVDTPDGYLLFDTGWSGPILLENLRRFNIQLEKIKYVFLSHFHWDHIGGLPDLLAYIKPIVYVLNSFSTNFKNEVKKITELIEVKNKSEILPGFFSTGGINNKNIVEQSLVIKYKNNIIVISGCAHPGLDKILEKASSIGKVNYIIGGFHDFKNLEILSVVNNIMPCHCTKFRENILEKYATCARRIEAGSIIKIV
jgi:7,8-dihydropterin-6-yl-methyl-4-(beta-D-ribofuranosyl)aminobenzene 5'-phosphate synthase